MGIIKKNGPYYYAVYHNEYGSTRCVPLKTANKQIALRLYQDIIRRRNETKEKLPLHITWDAFKYKLFRHISIDKAPSTIREVKLACRYLEDVKKVRFLQDVNPELLQRYKEYLIRKGYRNVYINDLVACMKAVMRQGEKWEFVPKQDWSSVSLLKAPRGRVVFHTPEEINKLLAACPSENGRIIVLLGADAGLRRGEIPQLRWQDVDFENNQLYIAPNKTEYCRYIPMTKSLRNALQRAKIGARDEFVVELPGSRLPDYVATIYKEIANAAGVPSFLHKLRHTFASQLVQNGVELYTVSQLLGHRSIQKTEIYAHLAPATLHKAVFNLPKRGMQLVGMEERTVCEGNKACRQIGVDFGDLMRK